MKHNVLKIILKIVGMVIGAVVAFTVSVTFIIVSVLQIRDCLWPESDGCYNVGDCLYVAFDDAAPMCKSDFGFNSRIAGNGIIFDRGTSDIDINMISTGCVDSILIFKIYDPDSTAHYYLLDKVGITYETLPIEVWDRMVGIDSIFTPLVLYTNQENICWRGFSAERKQNVINGGQADSLVMSYCNWLTDIEKDANSTERYGMLEALTAPQPENDIFALNLYVLTRIMKEYDNSEVKDETIGNYYWPVGHRPFGAGTTYADIVKTIGRYSIRNLDNNTENVLISLDQDKEYASYYLKYLARELYETNVEQKSQKITLKDLVLPSTVAAVSSNARLKRIFDALADDSSKKCALMLR